MTARATRTVDEPDVDAAIADAEIARLRLRVKELEADMQLLLMNLQWSNVGTGQAYLLRGVHYDHLLYGPLNQLKAKVKP
jgi:hypothetical protein